MGSTRDPKGKEMERVEIELKIGGGMGGKK